MVEEKIIVSFIISAFNGAAYLSRCLNSIRSQGNSGFEIIVVNDGSTDETKELLASLRNDIPHLKIVNNEVRQGSLRSRLLGAQEAKGKYIHFIDCDDTLAPDCFSCGCKALQAKDFDILEFNAKIVDKNENPVSGALDAYCNRNLNTVFEGENVFKDFFARKNHSFCIWGKWFKRELVEKTTLDIPEGCFTMADDFCFCTIASFYAKSKRVISDYLYHYTCNTGISTTQTSSIGCTEKILSMLKLLPHVKYFLQSKGKFDRYENDFIHWENSHLDGIFAIVMTCKKNQRQSLFRTILENYPPLTVIRTLATIYHGKEVDIADSLTPTVLPVVSKKIRTIGIYYYRIDNGGVERVISQWTDLYVRMGYKVVLLTDFPRTADSYPLPDSVSYHTFSTGPLYSSKHMHMRPRLAEWEKVIQEKEIDVVIYNAYTDPHLLWDLLTIRFTNTPVLLYAHGLFSYLMHIQFPSWEIFKSFNNFANGMICISRVDAAWWRIAGINTKYLPNPLTIQRPKAPSFEKKNKNLIWIGRISAEKQPQDAVKAFAIISKKIPDARLIFVGKSEEGSPVIEELQKEIKRCELETKISFAGFSTNVESHLEQAAIHIFTSAFEGFGLVLLEAKQFAIPAVSYHLPNIEPLRLCKGHICVDQGDYEALAEQVVHLLEHPDILRNMAEDAYNSVAYFQNYPYEEEWIDIFHKLEKNEPFSQEPLEQKELETVANLITDGYKASRRTQVERIQELEKLLAHEVQFYQKELEIYKKELEYYKQRAEHNPANLPNPPIRLPDDTEHIRTIAHLEHEIKYHQLRNTHLKSLLEDRQHHKIIRVATHFDDWTHKTFPTGSLTRKTCVKLWNFLQVFRHR